MKRILRLSPGIQIPPEVFDFAGFRKWALSPKCPEKMRVCFVDGFVEIDMSKEEIETHNKLKSAMNYAFEKIARSFDLGEVLVDGAMLVNAVAGIVNNPDLMFCSWESLQAEKVRYQEVVRGSKRYVEVEGSPDVTVEVISRRSVRKDTKELPPGYFAAGVREYWLADGRGPRVLLTIFVRGETEFVAAIPDEDGWIRSDVFDCKVRLERTRNRVGGFTYDLQMSR